MVQFVDVKKTYPNGTEALRGISFQITDGEFVFLVGPSGSGKSTIIRLMNAELRPTSGDVVINDFSLSRIKQRKIPYLRRTLGVIFQDFRLIEDKSVFDNVAFAMRAIGVKRRYIKPRVQYVLSLVGLENHGKRHPSQISGGEQQRVAIARALVNNPSLIIADEPTGNLDPARSMEIMELLERINSMGTTVVVVTHEKGLVNHFNKRVIAIDEGLVISDGTGGYYESLRHVAPPLPTSEYDGYEEYADPSGKKPAEGGNSAKEAQPHEQAAKPEQPERSAPIQAAPEQPEPPEPENPEPEAVRAAPEAEPVPEEIPEDVVEISGDTQAPAAAGPEESAAFDGERVSAARRVPTFAAGEITAGLVSQEEALEAILSGEKEGSL